MPYGDNPFVRIDRRTVVASLAEERSRDPDVLNAKKGRLVAALRFPKAAGFVGLGLGAVLSTQPIGAVIGLPLIVAGGWALRRSAANQATIEAVYSEFVKTPRQ